MIRDGQRIAVKFTLENRRTTDRWGGRPPAAAAACPVARPAAALNEAMTIENRVDGAFGRNPCVAIEPPHQELTNLARAPQCGFSHLRQTMRRSTCVGSWLAQRTGRRGRSERASSPCSL